jgi:threonine aldolase
MTWKAGVDIVSFGATKNGCWAAEAIVCFRPERFSDLGLLRTRAGHRISKSRFVAAQFEGYLDNGHWLDNARHANAMARRLAEGLERRGAGTLAWPAEGNEVFAVLDTETLATLKAAGASFYVRPQAGPDLRLAEGETVVRLVTSFATTPEEVDRFLSLLPDAAAGLAAMLLPPL